MSDIGGVRPRASGLRNKLKGILESSAGRCLDNEEDFKQVLDALEDGIRGLKPLSFANACEQLRWFVHLHGVHQPISADAARTLLEALGEF